MPFARQAAVAFELRTSSVMTFRHGMNMATATTPVG